MLKNINSNSNNSSSNNLGGKSFGLSNYHTPHKTRSKNELRQVLGPVSSVQKIKQVPPVSTVKKKAVSFAIHTEPEELSLKKYDDVIDKSSIKLKDHTYGGSRHEMYEDEIEVSAGRTG